MHHVVEVVIAVGKLLPGDRGADRVAEQKGTHLGVVALRERPASRRPLFERRFRLADR